MKKHNTLSDYLAIIFSGLMFLAIIGFGIWATSLSIEKNPDLIYEEFIAEFIKRAVLTIMLVSSGLNLSYTLTKIIITSIGSRNYNNNIGQHTPGYRYIESKEGINETKKIIDKHGLILELEETVEFMNFERKAESYEDIIDNKIYKYSKDVMKKKLTEEKRIDIKNKLNETKSHKLILSKFRSSIAKYNKEKCIELDEELSKIYGEPKYQIVYTKDIYNIKPVNRNFIDIILNSRIYLFIKERIIPIVSPLIFVILLTYYILEFKADRNNINLLLAVGITTIIAMFKAALTEILGRFERINTIPYEENNYIFKKFKSKNKDIIKALEDGMTIEEYYEIKRYKTEKLKEKLNSKEKE